MSLLPDLRPSFLFLFFLSLASHIQFSHGLGIKFVTPGPGATYPAGPFTVTWADAGGDVSLADLATYNLYLIVGGNSPGNFQVLMTLNTQPNAPIQDLSLAATIPSNIGQSIQNGFYLQMVSNTTTGNQTINYSNRFTLIELTGTTDSQYVQGAASSVGDSNVPPAQFNNFPLPSTTSPQQPSTSASIGPIATETGVDGDGDGGASRFSISGGALVGLTVGTICAVILFLLLGVLGFFWWRGRRLRQRQAEQNKSLDGSAEAGAWPDKVELSARLSSQSPPATRGIAPIAELSHEHAVAEAMSPVPAVEADSEVRYELEGDWTGWEAAARRSRVASYDPLR